MLKMGVGVMLYHGVGVAVGVEEGIPFFIYKRDIRPFSGKKVPFFRGDKFKLKIIYINIY